MSAFLLLLVKVNLAMGAAIILVSLLRRPLRLMSPIISIHVPAAPTFVTPEQFRQDLFRAAISKTSHSFVTPNFSMNKYFRSDWAVKLPLCAKSGH